MIMISIASFYFGFLELVKTLILHQKTVEAVFSEECFIHCTVY